jgi:hypothetical protein
MLILSKWTLSSVRNSEKCFIAYKQYHPPNDFPVLAFLMSTETPNNYVHK